MELAGLGRPGTRNCLQRRGAVRVCRRVRILWTRCGRGICRERVGEFWSRKRYPSGCENRSNAGGEDSTSAEPEADSESSEPNQELRTGIEPDSAATESGEDAFEASDEDAGSADSDNSGEGTEEDGESDGATEDEEPEEEGGESDAASGGEEEGGEASEEGGGENGEAPGGEEGGGGEPEPLPYPEKTAYQLKALQPDFWPDKNEIAGNGTGGIAVNMVWASWEPQPTSLPCAPGTIEYDGHCYSVDNGFDNAVRSTRKMGVHVTAVVYGVPEWARQNVACSPVTAGFEIFCKPDNPADYGRFAGMLADRYDGHKGNGRIIDFVIHNEVNANDWFDVGCGQGFPATRKFWVETYAESYTAAYDAIVAEQPHAKVLMSFDHHFGEEFQQPAASNPRLSVAWFLKEMEQYLGNRDWRVAYHIPIPPDLLQPGVFCTGLPEGDLRKYRNGRGFLHAEFPNDPHAWDVQLTESGEFGGASFFPCQRRRRAFAIHPPRTSFGDSRYLQYVYHRMRTTRWRRRRGRGCGLADENGTLKPAWGTWAMANRHDLSPPQLSCGFEYVPYTRLVRGTTREWAIGNHPTPSPWLHRGTRIRIVSGGGAGDPSAVRVSGRKRQLCFHGFQLRGATSHGPPGVGPFGSSPGHGGSVPMQFRSWRSHDFAGPELRGVHHGASAGVCLHLASPLAQLKPSRPSIWLSRPSRASRFRRASSGHRLFEWDDSAKASSCEWQSREESKCEIG